MNEVDVIECCIPQDVPFWKRNPTLFLKYLRLPHDFDAIFVAETNQASVPLAKFLAFMNKKPVIFDIFFSMYDSYVNDRRTVASQSMTASLFYQLDKLSLRSSTLILADTQQHFDYYHQFFHVPPEKLRTIYVGCDAEPFMQDHFGEQTSDGTRFTITFTGTFIPLHGIQYILRAAKLLEQYEDIHFEITGKGQTYDQMKRLAEQLQARHCSFLEPVPFFQLPSVISRGTICLGIFGDTTKAQRVIPNKVYQYLAMKKPVITGDSPAIREVFQHEQHVFLCQMADEHALAEAIVRLKKDTALRNRISENGFHLVTERFTPKVLGNQLKDAIISLL
ncbi:MAG: glycosyltransferase family 4 protein [bacterium]|nr:glycosyltransferase family 4 protein [bacterium]